MSPSDIFRLVAIVGSVVGVIGTIGLFFSTRISDREKNQRIDSLEEDLRTKDLKISDLEAFSNSIRPGLKLVSQEPMRSEGGHILILSFGSPFPVAVPVYNIRITTSVPYDSVQFRTDGRLNQSDGIIPIEVIPGTSTLQIRGTQLSPNCLVKITITSKQELAISDLAITEK